ncbi:MAG: DegV family EDD domain-containing protein, partial [Spirochaetales bacterium]|nr:DegV family EDD domain-containing protein [Spirochaetales bacterium]
GAMGFVSFLEGINTLQKNGFVNIDAMKKIKSTRSLENISVSHSHNLENNVITSRYCTEVLLGSFSGEKIEIKNKLQVLGDSMVLTQGVDKLRVHIHTNYPDKVVSLLKKDGKILEQKAEDMIRQEQVVNSKKGEIAVLTDSIADIPRDLLDKYQVHLVNIKLLWGEDEYIDRVTITSEQFYKEQELRKEFPGSSLPSEADIDTIYRYLLDHYSGVIVLPVGKQLSGTWNIMTKVAEKVDPIHNKICVIDTCLNSVAQGLLVQEVAKKAVSGSSLFELRDFANSLKSKIKIYVSVNTFKYMVKGGRVSPLKGFIASALNLKPIVSLDSNGKGTVMGKAFSRKGLIKQITKIVSSTNANKGIRSFALVHADDLEGSNVFSNRISRILNKNPDYITSISSIVGMHSGKGAIAIGIIEA